MAGALLAVMQGFLSAFDSSMGAAIREEERDWFEESIAWRASDMSWRSEERAAKDFEQQKRRQVLGWREEDLKQMNVENARTLWLRFVERNRRDVEEKTEQLKAILNVSAFFGLCATVTLTQLAISSETSKVLVGLYAATTAAVEGLMTIAMVTCALILGSILKIGKTYVDEIAEQEFFVVCREFCENFSPGDRPPCPRKSFEQFWELRCESSWQLAFQCCRLGVSAFFISMGAIGWIVFFPQAAARVSSAVIAALAVVLWSIVQASWGAYWKANKRKHSDVFEGTNLQDPLADGSAGLPFDWHLTPHQETIVRF